MAFQDDDLPENLKVIQLLWEIDHGLNKRSRFMLKHHGLTAEQRFMVHLVSLREGCSPGQLARLLRVTPATVTRGVRRLEKNGYLERSEDPQDSRKIQLRLTPKGRKLEERPEGRGEGPISLVVARTPRARVEESMKFLEELSAALNQPPE